MTVMRVAALEPDVAPADADHAEALRIRASFGRLARDLAASRSSCAAARESVGPVLANL
jgi:hypothetical protein